MRKEALLAEPFICPQINVLQEKAALELPWKSFALSSDSILR